MECNHLENLKFRFRKSMLESLKGNQKNILHCLLSLHHHMFHQPLTSRFHRIYTKKDHIGPLQCKSNLHQFLNMYYCSLFIEDPHHHKLQNLLKDHLRKLENKLRVLLCTNTLSLLSNQNYIRHHLMSWRHHKPLQLILIHLDKAHRPKAQFLQTSLRYHFLLHSQPLQSNLKLHFDLEKLIWMFLINLQLVSKSLKVQALKRIVPLHLQNH